MQPDQMMHVGHWIQNYESLLEHIELSLQNTRANLFNWFDV